MQDGEFPNFDRIVAVPSFHSRLEFALLVRRAFFQFHPSAVCVELPAPFADVVEEGIRHLPNISVIAYQSEHMLQPNYIPIDPCDSIIESARLALALDVPLEFIDLPVEAAPPPLASLPDEYALRGVPLAQFNATIAASTLLSPYIPDVPDVPPSPPPETEQDADYVSPQNLLETPAMRVAREQFMAWNLERVLREYDGPILLTCGMTHWDPLCNFVGQLGDYKPPGPFPLFNVDIFNVHPDSIYKVLREVPYVAGLYEQERDRATRVHGASAPSKAIFEFDRYECLPDIFFRANDAYQETYHEVVSVAQFKVLFQYARNLAMVNGKIVPCLFDLVSAAKDVSNDDYAGLVFDVARHYPWVDRENKYPFLEFVDDTQQVGGSNVPLRRYLPVEEGEPQTLTLKRRPKEPYKNAWREAWGDTNTGDLVSWPPEDIIFEDYMRFIKVKAKRFLRSKLVSVHEFTTSFLDGIAIKETLQNWWRKKIFVKEERIMKGDVGPIVAIFSEDPKAEEFPWNFTWYAEHAGESDLCVYATRPEEHIIGPKIAEIEVGGLLSVFPPVGPSALRDPWESFFSGREFRETLAKYTQMRSDMLLIAAIFNATKEQKYIAYIGTRPPRDQLRALAEQRGHHVVFLPLNSFSPTSLKRLRRLHVLRGRKVRDYAGQYIFI